MRRLLSASAFAAATLTVAFAVVPADSQAGPVAGLHPGKESFFAPSPWARRVSPRSGCLPQAGL